MICTMRRREKKNLNKNMKKREKIEGGVRKDIESSIVFKSMVNQAC